MRKRQDGGRLCSPQTPTCEGRETAATLLSLPKGTRDNQQAEEHPHTDALGEDRPTTEKGGAVGKKTPREWGPVGTRGWAQREGYRVEYGHAEEQVDGTGKGPCPGSVGGAGSRFQPNTAA